MLESKNEVHRGLTYPWGRNADPIPGEPQKVAEGVYWARFSMPLSLNHINLWLLEDEDGWTVVDTCLDLPSAGKPGNSCSAALCGTSPSSGSSAHTCTRTTWGSPAG